MIPLSGLGPGSGIELLVVGWVGDRERTALRWWSRTYGGGGLGVDLEGEPEDGITQMVVCVERERRVDLHVDGEVEVIAGPSMASFGPCCDIVKGGQGWAPAEGGHAGGGRDRQRFQGLLASLPRRW